MIEDGIRSRLIADADVSALVSSRIYPAMTQQAPQKPYITYQRISTPRLHALGGPTGTAKARLQLNCWSDSYGEALDLADKARKALDGHRFTAGEDEIDWVIVQDERDAQVSRKPGERISVQGRQMDIHVWYSEIP